jgi:hypothetical protein
MPDGTGANRDEIHQAIEALTPGERLKLKHFAAWRMRGLGRAVGGRTWEDLLCEAKLAMLEGAANNGSGRRWKGNVDFVTHFIGAMRSISSHWKRDFDEREADLESEVLTRTEEGDVISPLDNAMSHAPSQERELAARQQWNLIVTRCCDDLAATQVIDGLSRGLTTTDVMRAYGLTIREYRQATKRIRHRGRDMDQAWGRGL